MVRGYEIKALKGMQDLLQAKAVAGMFVEISPGKFHLLDVIFLFPPSCSRFFFVCVLPRVFIRTRWQWY